MSNLGPKSFAAQLGAMEQPQTRANQSRMRPESSNSFASQLEDIMQGPNSSSTKDRIQNAVKQASQKYNVPQNLVLSIIKQESAFQPDATSHCGAQGLMQLMPETAKDLGVKDAYNIEQNIDGGTKYISQMLKMFGGDTKKALAAYNAGPGNVQKYGGIPPFKETQNYVKRISANLAKGNVGIPNNLPEAPGSAPLLQAQGPQANMLSANYKQVNDISGPGQLAMRNQSRMTVDLPQSTAVENAATTDLQQAKMIGDIAEDKERLDEEQADKLPSHAILV